MKTTIDSLKDYYTCKKCGNAVLSRFVFGGVGDWRTTSVCCVCHHVRRGLNFAEVIVPLVARQYDTSETAARAALQAQQEGYERYLAATLRERRKEQ